MAVNVGKALAAGTKAALPTAAGATAGALASPGGKDLGVDAGIGAGVGLLTQGLANRALANKVPQRAAASAPAKSTTPIAPPRFASDAARRRFAPGTLGVGAAALGSLGAPEAPAEAAPNPFIDRLLGKSN